MRIRFSWGQPVFATGAEIIIDEDNWTDLPINQYSFERIEREAEKIGMKAARLGRVFQDWFCVYHEDNQIALDGIEQASKIAWNKVLPKWETPPDWGKNHLGEKKSAGLEQFQS